MRQLASVLVSVGAVLAAIVALAPVSVSLPLREVDCGAPAVRYYSDASVPDDNEQAIIDRCEDVAAQRLKVSAALVSAGLIAGLLALMAAWRREARARRRAAARRQERADRDARPQAPVSS